MHFFSKCPAPAAATLALILFFFILDDAKVTPFWSFWWESYIRQALDDSLRVSVTGSSLGFTDIEHGASAVTKGHPENYLQA